jgi:hypothetical protein
VKIFSQNVVRVYYYDKKNLNKRGIVCITTLREVQETIVAMEEQ